MTKIIAAIALLLTLSAGWAVFDADGRYHTTLLTPDQANGWRQPTPINCDGCKPDPNPPCAKPYANPIRCIIFPSKTVPGSAEFRTDAIRLLLIATDLKDPLRPVRWDPGLKVETKGRVMMEVIVWTKKPETPIRLDRIRVVDPCGPGVKRRKDGAIAARMVRETRIVILPSATWPMPDTPGYHREAVLVEADPSRILECTLDFSAVLPNGKGPSIPRARFESIQIAYWRPLN